MVRGRVPYTVFYVYTEACSVMHGCILKARANVRIWYVFVKRHFSGMLTYENVRAKKATRRLYAMYTPYK